jgi:Protein of unknown function (DUF4235)
MKILYLPFGLIASAVSSFLGRTVFKSLWSRIDEQEPPKATAGEGSLSKVVVAASLQAATTAAVSAAVNRMIASTFHYLFGVWPGGEKEKKKANDERSDSGR